MVPPLARIPLRLRRHAARNRRDPTRGERRLWQALRAGKTGTRFRRQQVIGPYICDFVSLSARIVVEVDGDRHLSEQRRRLDHRRDEHLRDMGYRVLRVTEYEARHMAWRIADEVWALVHGEPVPPAPGEHALWE